MTALARGDEHRAHGLFEQVLRESPETNDSALALDYLLDLSGERAIPEKNYPCSPEAEAAARKGQDERLRGRLVEAAARFDEAARLCPGNPEWLVQSGDVALEAGNRAGARSKYEAALALDPWHREAHSRLGDVLSAQGNADEGLRHHVLSVVSDPMYQGGWFYLGKAVRLRGGTLLRRYERKPSMNSETGQLTVYTDGSTQNIWPSYAFGHLVIPAVLEKQGNRNPTALEVERGIVDHLLETDQSTDPRSFWSLVARAKEKGLEDEAIFMGLMDRRLGREYPAFREKNASGLERYVREIAIQWNSATAENLHLSPVSTERR